MSSVSHAVNTSQYFSYSSGGDTRFSFRCRLFLFITGTDPSASDMPVSSVRVSGQSSRREVQAGKESSKTLNPSSKFRDAGPVRNIARTMSFQAHGCWEAGKGLLMGGVPDTRASHEPVRPFFRSPKSASQGTEDLPGGNRMFLILMWYLQSEAQGSSSVLYHRSCRRRPNCDTAGKNIQKCQAISDH